MKKTLLSLIAGSAVLAGATLTGYEARAQGPVYNPDGSLKEIVISKGNSQKNRNSNYKVEDFNLDSDQVILARMIFGEARNCSDLEKVAVAYTALNRANDGKVWNGTNVKEAVLKKWQYSCFNKDDPNLPKLKNPEKYDFNSFQKCLEIAGKVLKGEYKDPTNGATHYHTKEINPNWKNSPTMIPKTTPADFKHNFYREK